MRFSSTTGRALAGKRQGPLRLTTVAFLAALVAAPALAQSGEIIVLRQVGPRNAINPGTSNNVLAVKTAPDDSYFNSIGSTLRQLSDADAAMVSSGRPSNLDVDGMIRIALDGAFGTSGYTENARSDHSASMAGGGVVSSSISQGMSALQNALGTIRTSVPSGR